MTNSVDNKRYDDLNHAATQAVHSIQALLPELKLAREALSPFTSRGTKNHFVAVERRLEQVVRELLEELDSPEPEPEIISLRTKIAKKAIDLLRVGALAGAVAAGAAEGIQAYVNLQQGARTVHLEIEEVDRCFAALTDNSDHSSHEEPDNAPRNDDSKEDTEESSMEAAPGTLRDGQSILEEMASSHQPAVRAEAAKRTESEVLLERLATDPTVQVRSEVARRSDSPELLRQLMSDIDSDVRQIVAERTDHEDALIELAGDVEPQVREIAFKKIRNPDHLANLATHSSRDVRLQAMQLIEDEAQLERLAHSDRPAVRLDAANYIHNQKVLAELALDVSPEIRTVAISKISDDSILLELASNTRKEVRFSIADHTTSEDLIEALAADPDEEVRKVAVTKIAAIMMTEEAAGSSRFSKDLDSAVRMDIARLVDDQEVLTRLAADDVSQIRSAAVKRLDNTPLSALAATGSRKAQRTAANEILGRHGSQAHRLRRHPSRHVRNGARRAQLVELSRSIRVALRAFTRAPERVFAAIKYILTSAPIAFLNVLFVLVILLLIAIVIIIAVFAWTLFIVEPT